MHKSRLACLVVDGQDDVNEAAYFWSQALGAGVVERLEAWVVMQAPTRHRFCIVNPQCAGLASAPGVNVWR